MKALLLLIIIFAVGAFACDETAVDIEDAVEQHSEWLLQQDGVLAVYVDEAKKNIVIKFDKTKGATDHLPASLDGYTVILKLVVVP